MRTPTSTTRFARTAWPLFLAGVASLSACKGGPDAPIDPTARPEARLRRMADCDDLRGELVQRVTEMLVQNRYSTRGGWLAEDGVAAAEDGASGDSAGGAAPPTDFTGTNNQEAGVDELDLVKNDGEHLYIAQDRALHIVKSWPADQTAKLATLELDGWAAGLFQVDPDTLVVIAQVYGEEIGISGDMAWRAIVRMTTVDVSDRAAPKVVRSVDLDGSLVDARMIDGAVTFVASQWIDVPQSLWDVVWDEDSTLPAYPEDYDDTAAWEAAQAEARAILQPQVEAALAGIDLDDLLPQWRTDAGAAFETMHECADLYAPRSLAPLSVLSVGTYDAASGALGATGILSDGWTVYASASNLYVAQSSRWWWGWDEDTVSHIHKFGLHGSDEPTYEASGEVEGWLYDQFAMSEHAGHLRVVSTDFRQWWGEPEEEDATDPANRITILKDDGGGAMTVTGSVEGIAPNEQIQAARMMGDKGYIVTFEQVDPLFTLDLSDPTDPRVVGELKIPGFSAYLHPLDADHLIGVGRAGTWDGAITGMAILVFDVSDFANPIVKYSHEIDHGDGWSWSEVLWDHHAFTYHRDTLTLPAMTEHYDSVTGTWEGFSGTISFKVTADAPITELGRVDHADLVPQSECLWDRWYDWGAEPGYSACGWDAGYWYARIRRSAYIEDNLYTISDYGVKVNDLTDPSVEIDRVVFYPR